MSSTSVVFSLHLSQIELNNQEVTIIKATHSYLSHKPTIYNTSILQYFYHKNTLIPMKHRNEFYSLFSFYPLLVPQLAFCTVLVMKMGIAHNSIIGIATIKYIPS